MNNTVTTPDPHSTTAAGTKPTTADVVFINGQVVCMDDAGTTAEALAVQGNKIIAVGTKDAVAAHQGPDTRVIDLDGATLLPGINDAHVHVLPVGFMMVEMDLNGKPLDAVRTELEQVIAAHPAGTVIKGTGWSEGAFGRAPTRADLDDLSPDHPVVLTEMSHHAVLLNTRALELVGFGDDIKDENGVTFVRDADTGALTGVIVEGYTLVNEKLPQPSLQDRKDAIQRAIGMMNAQGITSVTEPGLTVEEIKAYRALAAEGALNARASVHLWAGSSLEEAQEVIASLPEGVSAAGKGTTEGLFTLRGMKFLIDGVPPAGTSATFDDYASREGVRGHLTFSGDTDEERALGINRAYQALHDQGYQIAFHATGDRGAAVGIGALVAAMENSPTSKDNPKSNDLRHYMIHGDRVRTEELNTMADWGIGLSTNPLITYFAGGMVAEIWGEDYGKRHMATGLFREAGVAVTFGTDSPVVPPNWIQGMEFAVNRTRIDGAENGPEYTISAQEAVRAHTIAAAYQDHQDDIKGSLEVGKCADLVVFDQNFLEIAPEAISKSKALMTMVDGRVVHDAMSAG